MKPIIRLEQVSYYYQNSVDPVLKDISLDIRRGEFHGLIGSSGSGKTTFCLSLSGIVPQFFGGRFFGHITVTDLDTLNNPVSTLAKHVGIVFEDPETQLISTSVENEIAFALENLCIPKEEILKRIPNVLEAVRLDGYEKKHPHQLSGGQKQRLAIAAALALQPEVLVLDEPTSHLDTIGAQEVFSTIKELNDHLDVTILMASHAAEEMAEFSDRISLIAHGELLNTDSPNKIYTDIELFDKHHLRPPQVTTTFDLISKSNGSFINIPVTLEAGKNTLQSLITNKKRFPDFEDSNPTITTEPTLNPTRIDSVSQIQTNHEIENNTNDADTILSAQNLKYTYDDGTQALKGISIDISSGEYVLLIGQNGAGKSTLVKHFLNLLEPTVGIVRFKGMNTRELSTSDLARQIGYVGQNPDHQIFNSTVEAEVSFALRNLEFEESLIEYRTAESLKMMGLWSSRNAHPLSLTKGERARVVIAAVLALRPEIIIFDEPTTGQDYHGACSILDISQQLHKEGKTVIVVTHHLHLMSEYAQRVIVMGKGNILLDAPIRNAYHQTELLRSTFLMPPQAVLLSQELSRINSNDIQLITPSEVAKACIDEYLHKEIS